MFPVDATAPFLGPAGTLGTGAHLGRRTWTCVSRRGIIFSVIMGLFQRQIEFF